MILLDLGQVAPRLLWRETREFSACFLLGTVNQRGFNVLVCTKPGRGAEGPGDSGDHKGKGKRRGLWRSGFALEVKDRPPHSAFHGQDGNGGDTLPQLPQAAGGTPQLLVN